ncbi:MAG TPA: tetratricopeptide repeat protein, partial [Myxococcota bacterium]|nr:tetratricopeptide repeat protein [Myxococcota bacterium]
LWLGAGCASAPVDSLPRGEARQALASGRSAYERRQWGAASAAFGRAALIFAALDESSAESAALRDRGEALRRAGDAAGGAAAYQRALEIDQRLGQGQAQAWALGGLARCAAAQQQTALAVGLAEQALALAAPGTPLAAALQNDLALYLLESGDPGRALELLTQASASNEARGDTRGVATNALNLGRAEFAIGRGDSAQGHLDRALEGFRGLQDPEGLAQTHELLARLSLARHELEQARLHQAQARAGYGYLDDRAGLRRLESLPLPEPARAAP